MGGRAWPAGTPGSTTPKFCLCPRLPAEPQVPREGGGTLFGSPPGGPQLVATVWAGFPQRQQLAVPRAPGQRGPAHSARRPGKGETRVLEMVHLPPGATVTKDDKLCGLKWQKCILEPEVQNHRADGAVCPLEALEGSFLAASGPLPCGHVTPVSLPVITWPPPLCVCLQISLFLLWRHCSLGLGSPGSLTFSKLTSAWTLHRGPVHRYQRLGLRHVLCGAPLSSWTEGDGPGGQLLTHSAPCFPQDLQPLRYLDGVPSSFQFFLPLGSGGALHLPASSFLTPPKDKCLSPELPLPKQLVCRWAKVSGEPGGAGSGAGGPLAGSARSWPRSVTSPSSSSKTW